MAATVLATLRTRLRPFLLELRRLYLIWVWGMEIGRRSQISFSASLDKTNPRGVHIGEETIVTLGAIVLTHDALKNRHLDTRIGNCCFVGTRSIIMPGVSIGDGSVIGAGAVVLSDVPPGSVLVGNPAVVVKSGFVSGAYGVPAAAPPRQPAGCG